MYKVLISTVLVIIFITQSNADTPANCKQKKILNILKMTFSIYFHYIKVLMNKFRVYGQLLKVQGARINQSIVLI